MFLCWTFDPIGQALMTILAIVILWQIDPLLTLGVFVPLLLIVGIFMVKYVVGVELAMAPRLAHDAQYALVVATLYGAFTGVFVGRAARLWRLALRPAAAGVPA